MWAWSSQWRPAIWPMVLPRGLTRPMWDQADGTPCIPAYLIQWLLQPVLDPHCMWCRSWSGQNGLLAQLSPAKAVANLHTVPVLADYRMWCLLQDLGCSQVLCAVWISIWLEQALRNSPECRSQTSWNGHQIRYAGAEGERKREELLARSSPRTGLAPLIQLIQPSESPLC